MRSSVEHLSGQKGPSVASVASVASVGLSFFSSCVFSRFSLFFPVPCDSARGLERGGKGGGESLFTSHRGLHFPPSSPTPLYLQPTSAHPWPLFRPSWPLVKIRWHRLTFLSSLVASTSSTSEHGGRDGILAPVIPCEFSEHLQKLAILAMEKFWRTCGCLLVLAGTDLVLSNSQFWQ